MHKNAHRKLYLKERGKMKRERKRKNNREPRAEWRHKTSGFNFISLFSMCVCFFIILFSKLTLRSVRWPIAGFVLFVSRSLFLGWLGRCGCFCFCWCMSYILILLPFHFSTCTRSFYSLGQQTIDSVGAKNAAIFIIPQVMPKKPRRRQQQTTKNMN